MIFPMFVSEISYNMVILTKLFSQCTQNSNKSFPSVSTVNSIVPIGRSPGDVERERSPAEGRQGSRAQ